MRLDNAPDVHLTYCTNVHPGESWPETLANLETFLPPIKARLAPDRPFGIGLRLSAAAAEGLGEPGALDAFRAFLARHDLYVFTINGFPYGRFHDTRVKEAVYRPDWRDPERLAYTDRLADLLAELLPEGVPGSVSTVPGGFKPDIATKADIRAVADKLIRHAVHLAGIEARSGRLIQLALEPEPRCFLETVDETIRFFESSLFSGEAVETAAALGGCAGSQAESLLRRHLGVCYDVCHAAVEYEQGDALDRLAAAGIAIPKIQLSSALRLPRADGDARKLLAPFVDGVYLHQVVARNAMGLTRYTDLDDAFASLESGPAEPPEWRVHFHVPVFLDGVGALATTQPDLKAVLARQRRAPLTQHLEVETYTWGVLPPEKRSADLASDIAREVAWVKQALVA